MGIMMSALASTPTQDSLQRRFSDFATLGEALDYAALGQRGLNFHDMRGQLARPYPYSEMREDALKMAYRLISHGITCLLYTSPSPRDRQKSRMPSSA